MSFPGRIYIAQGPWHFGDYRNIFLPYIGEDQKKDFTIRVLAPGTVSYDESGPGYCITFKKRLDEALR